MKSHKNPYAFTLLEILLVVAAIAILAGIIIYAVNPNKQLGDTRNVQRKVDISTLINAIYQYMVDNGGVIPSSVPLGTSCGVPAHEVCKSGAKSCAGLLDLDTYLVGTSSTYIVSVPYDPLGPSNNINSSGYEIYRSSNGRITACAPYAELGKDIKMTK